LPFAKRSADTPATTKAHRMKINAAIARWVIHSKQMVPQRTLSDPFFKVRRTPHFGIARPSYRLASTEYPSSCDRRHRLFPDEPQRVAVVDSGRVQAIPRQAQGSRNVGY
jgi:hypothetical protein